MANEPKFNPKNLEIWLGRHAETVSNVVGPENGLNLGKFGGAKKLLNEDRLVSLSKDLQHKQGNDIEKSVYFGTYWPDGLTDYGVDQTKQFVDHMTARYKLKNVRMLVSSPLTRAFQTMQENSKAFELVGPHCGDKTKPTIFCHHGLKESSPWPHNFPALVDGEGKAHYIRVRGGQSDIGEAAGEITGTQTVDLSIMKWASADASWKESMMDEEKRMAMLQQEPDISEIERSARDFRVWLREEGKKIVAEHERQNDPGVGPARIVATLHGGIYSVIMKRWHAERTFIGQDQVKWAQKSMVNNMQFLVVRFKEADDNEADFEEVEKNDEYQKLFGRYYAHMGTQGLHYTANDGTDEKRKASHVSFIKEKYQEVQNSLKENSFGVEAVVNWKGPEAFLNSRRK